MLFSPLPARRPAALEQSLYVPTYRQIHAQLAAELRRARRYEHSFSTVVLSPSIPVWGANRRNGRHLPPPVAEVTPTVYMLLGSFLRNVVREFDILTAAPESLSYAVFLPETHREQAEQTIVRVSRGFKTCSGFDLRTGCAEFPGDGLTVEDLLASAFAAWHGAPRDSTADVKSEVSHG